MVVLRRSSRQQKVGTPAVVGDSRAPVVNAATGSKGAPRGVATKKKKTTAKPKANNSTACAPSTPSFPVDRISSLPPEIFTMVLGNIDAHDQRTMNALGRTNKAFYALMMPRLYGRVVLHAQYHAHIAKLIRTLEPLLTIAQKKQLMKEGKYKGQQENGYPAVLDEDAKPICAEHVRQLVMGWVDPGRKHLPMVHRYLEEALKTLENLEVINTWVMNASVAQSLASLRHLQALSIRSQDMDLDDATSEALRRVRNLRHLALVTSDYSDVTQCLVRNSASTLRSLFLNTGSYDSLFFPRKHDPAGLAGSNGTADSDYRFPKLRSLRMVDLYLDQENMAGMLESVDFVKLDELPLGAAFATASQSTSPPKLRSLSLNLSEGVEGRIRFLASFGTLTKLVVTDYGHYKESTTSTTNPGLSSALLAAILSHRNLRTLEFTHPNLHNGRRIPHLSAQTVRALVEGLPELRELEFAPVEEEIDEIGQVLAAGAKNLESVTSPVYYRDETRQDDAGYYPNPGFRIVASIVRAFLDHAEPTSTLEQADQADQKEFVWEDHHRLRRAGASHRTWDIASKLPKQRKGVSKWTEPAKVTGNVHQDRGVWAWNTSLPAAIRLDMGFEPTPGWLDEVARDLA
ncbi:hypothetical protein PG996_010918 [Apiospora saccharicola]|uniref:F-box domain-containing protein n=1 Tax=Apiospora saccharicola TaxID=335842 RepID=A0ABR1UPX2_9PEZI